jgi:Predicted secreted protein
VLRANKVILVSHCILNQNSVVNPLARAKGAFDEIVKLITDRGYGIVQLPCPETLFLGLERLPMSKEEYATPEYIALCDRLATREIDYIKLLQEGTVNIAGMIGIDQSPTCCQFGELGHFMNALQKHEEIHSIPKIDIPELYIEEEEETENFHLIFKDWLDKI